MSESQVGRNEQCPKVARTRSRVEIVAFVDWETVFCVLYPVFFLRTASEDSYFGRTSGFYRNIILIEVSDP